MSKLLCSSVAAFGLLALVACSNEMPKYDPEPFRAEIEAIDAFVNKAAREPGDGGKLARLSNDLAGAIRPHIDNQRRRETVMNVIVMFGETFSQLEINDMPWELSEAREQWKGLRDELFERASWFEPL